jgi:hypothetical protein
MLKKLWHSAAIVAWVMANAAAVEATVQWPEETRPRCVVNPRGCVWSAAAPGADQWEPPPVEPVSTGGPLSC